MNQQLLIPDPQTPGDWCSLWDIALLDEIPHPGFATAKDIEKLPAAERKWPGRNDPRAGLWLWRKYGGVGSACADPMIGVGQLWLHIPHAYTLEGCDLESRRPELAPKADARYWQPRVRHKALVMFSPPYLQNHSAGATEHQQQIRDSKGLHAMQEFGGSPGNLGRMKPHEFWGAMLEVYRNVRTYTSTFGHMVVIVRNRVSKGREVNEIGEHIALMRAAGWRIEGAHPRALRPTGYTQWKVAADPSTPWVRYEWAVVATPDPHPRPGYEA